MNKILKFRSIFAKSNKFLSSLRAMQKGEEEAPDPAQMRVQYNTEHLDETKMEKDPLNEFKHWFKTACECKEISEPNAFILCTASKDGLPSGRPVLLKVPVVTIFLIL
jgi:Pyridoxamine-phosphate oxidase